MDTPFSPDPAVEEEGGIRLGAIENNYQTMATPRSAAAMHHPWAVGLETSVASRLSVEAELTDAIGLGMKAALRKEPLDGYDLSVGFDQLLYPTEKSLFGEASATESQHSGRAWLGFARTWKFLRPRAAIAVEPKSGHLRVVPHLAVESNLRLPFSMGMDARLESGIWRTDVGASLEWKPFRLGVGLGEFQSWICQKGKFGWYGTPRVGTASGVDNPGWWISASLDIPGGARREREAAPTAAEDRPLPGVDPQSLQPVADLLQQRQLRSEVAELAVRAKLDTGMDPTAMSILRRRILAGGPQARAALWRISLDPEIPLEERMQAVLTLSDDVTVADSSGLSLLSRDPVAVLRMEAALTLGRIPSAISRELLAVLVLDPEESVRMAAKASQAGP